MIAAFERRLLAQAWGISVALHGIAVMLAVLLVSHIKPKPLQDIFQWNVSLVEMVHVQSAETRAQAEGLPEPAPQAVVRPRQPVTTTSQVVPSRKPNPGLTERQQRLVETTPIMERSPTQMPAPAAVLQYQEAVAQMDATPVRDVTRGEEVQHVEPAPNPTIQSMVSEEQSSRGDASAPVRHASRDVDKVPPLEPAEPVQMAAIPKESGISQAPSEPPQPVAGTVRPTPVGRADYGWLIESVSKRLAELKRYPATARSNGLEGKVLLRAVIRADGQLVEVMVQKSSGHEELDMAAMETIREASPLHLRHDLGRAHIAIMVPLVYSLAR